MPSAASRMDGGIAFSVERVAMITVGSICSLMPRVLGTSEQELGYALQLLKRTGHITANTSERERTAASSVTEEAAAAASTAAPEAQSLLGKLWRKLGALTKGG